MKMFQQIFKQETQQQAQKWECHNWCNKGIKTKILQKIMREKSTSWDILKDEEKSKYCPLRKHDDSLKGDKRRHLNKFVDY